MYAQPDNRIGIRDLGHFFFNGKKYVVNRRPGVPRNACIEEFEGKLRCWASKIWLTDDAAKVVRENATFNEKQNHFTWNDRNRPR